MYARRAVLATLWIAHAFQTWSATAIIFTICVLQSPKGWIYNRAPLLALYTGRDHDHDNSCVYIWSNQLHKKYPRMLPADSDLMINWLNLGEAQIRCKTEIQLAFIFQRWDFANAFDDFDGSDRTSLAVGLAGHQGPKLSCEQPVPTLPRTFTWFL